jgi:hypothetical protein
MTKLCGFALGWLFYCEKFFFHHGLHLEISKT